MCSLLLFAKNFVVSLGESETKRRTIPRSVCVKRKSASPKAIADLICARAATRCLRERDLFQITFSKRTAICVSFAYLSVVAEFVWVYADAMKNFYLLLHRLEGLVLIPHELLHLLAHCLIGKPATYQFGQPFVEARAPLSRIERMFVLLFPLAVTWGIGVLWLAAAVIRVFTPPFANGASAPELLTRYAPSAIVAFLFFVYGSASHGDLLASVHLLLGKQANE